MEEKRIKEEIELQIYLNNLIEQDKQKQLSQLNDEVGTSIESEQMAYLSRQIETKCDRYSSELNSMFNQLDIRRKVSGQ